MKCHSILLAVAVSLTASTTFGDIIGVTAAADGDGAISCPDYNWGATTSIGLYGDQSGAIAHILGTITTDTELDPTLTIANSIDNDTGFDWAGYQVNVKMNKTFTLGSVQVTNPGDWTVLSVTQPVLVGSDWIGSIVYTGGTPVTWNPAGSIDFSFSMTFLGSAQWCEELVPIAVPEPGTASLLVLGALALAGRRLVRR
ncbi:MAG: PEP-CTERM sorting domain-containing protein [Verrucomicrobiota bacterium]